MGWRRIVAFILGYLACGVSYIVLQFILVDPFSALLGRLVHLKDAYTLLHGSSMILSIVVWILVYRSLIRNWSRLRDSKPDA